MLGSSCILDGEIVTWNRETKTYEPFGTNRTVALAGEDEGKQLCYKAFDILLLDDKTLIDLPLSQRRDILEKAIESEPHSFEVIDQITTATDTMGLMDALDNALLGGLEGIIVKRQDSSYLLNDRSNAWIKIKPDYVDGLGDNLDLLIIGLSIVAFIS
jgi:DNA ligase-4